MDLLTSKIQNSASDRRDIVLLSTADWDNPFWTNKQHVAVQLARRGYRVLYIESLGLRRPSVNAADTRRILRRLKRAIQSPRQVRDHLWVWSPVILPFQSFAAVRLFNRLWLTMSLNIQLQRLGFQRKMLWTYNPLTTRLLKTEGYHPLVYHCVDEVKAQPGMPVETLEQAERELLIKADIVFTTAPKLTETRIQWNQNTHYFSNVADFDHFATARDAATVVPDDLAKIPPPRLGFIGAISGYKIDFKLLRFLAEQRPDWSVVLIGKVGEGDPWTDPKLLEGLPNLHLLGPRPYADLPCYLKGFDVALLPNTRNDYTDCMFPMKFFEYLAAGKPVVGVDLPALQSYAGVYQATSTPQEFVSAVADALADRSGVPLEQRLALASLHTYETRTEKMMRLVEAIADSRTVELPLP